MPTTSCFRVSIATLPLVAKTGVRGPSGCRCLAARTLFGSKRALAETPHSPSAIPVRGNLGGGAGMQFAPDAEHVDGRRESGNRTGNDERCGDQGDPKSL